MPKYLIERRIPNAGRFEPADLREICTKSNGVLKELTGEGEAVAWVESYVTDDAIHCVYEASDPEVVREHARRGGFPADAVMEVRSVIGPGTGA